MWRIPRLVQLADRSTWSEVHRCAGLVRVRLRFAVVGLRRRAWVGRGNSPRGLDRLRMGQGVGEGGSWIRLGGGAWGRELRGRSIDCRWANRWCGWRSLDLWIGHTPCIFQISRRSRTQWHVVGVFGVLCGVRCCGGLPWGRFVRIRGVVFHQMC